MGIVVELGFPRAVGAAVPLPVAGGATVYRAWYHSVLRVALWGVNAQLRSVVSKVFVNLISIRRFLHAATRPAKFRFIIVCIYTTNRVRLQRRPNGNARIVFQIRRRMHQRAV